MNKLGKYVVFMETGNIRMCKNYGDLTCIKCKLVQGERELLNSSNSNYFYCLLKNELEFNMKELDVILC